MRFTHNDFTGFDTREDAYRALLSECLLRFRLAFVSTALVQSGHQSIEEPLAILEAAIDLLCEHDITTDDDGCFHGGIGA